MAKLTSEVILDGEIYVENGTVLDLSKKVNWHKAKFCVFDVLEIDGEDFTRYPYKDRKEALGKLIKDLDCKIVHLPKSWNGFDEAWKFVENNNWEGLMVKRLNGLYHKGRRTRDWGKIKRRLCVDVEILRHEAGNTKGTFIIKSPEGVECRVSGTSKDIVDYYYKHKPKKMEISYMFKTAKGLYFQPVFNKWVE